jgi:hypothetical protein
VKGGGLTLGQFLCGPIDETRIVSSWSDAEGKLWEGVTFRHSQVSPTLDASLDLYASTTPCLKPLRRRIKDRELPAKYPNGRGDACCRDFD